MTIIDLPQTKPPIRPQIQGIPVSPPPAKNSKSGGPAPSQWSNEMPGENGDDAFQLAGGRAVR